MKILKFLVSIIIALIFFVFGASSGSSKSKAASKPVIKPASKPSIKDVLTKLTPLALIANLAVALNSLGIDIPIIDVKQDGDDLLIILYGGRIERFPLDYNLTVKIEKLESTKDTDQPIRTALAALGKDKDSPADWLPDPGGPPQTGNKPTPKKP